MKTLHVTSLLIASLFVVSAGMAAPSVNRTTASGETGRTATVQTASGETLGKTVIKRPAKTGPRSKLTIAPGINRRASIQASSEDGTDKAVSKTPPRKRGPRGKTW